jgi:hypothetical protein
MSGKRADHRSSGSKGLSRRGRRRTHTIEAYIEMIRYVEDQQQRTGLPLNKILKYGVFVQAMSGSPASCSDGPDCPTVLHVLRGATLRRRYFEAQAWLKQQADSRGLTALGDRAR